MKNILFIFLISIFIYSCVKKDDAKKVTATTGYTLSTAGAIDSMHLAYDQYYRFRLTLPSGFDTFNTIRFKHGTPDSICEYISTFDTITLYQVFDSVTFPLVPCYSFYRPLSPYDYANAVTNGSIWMKTAPNFSWHDYLDTFSCHDHFVYDSFFATIGVNTRYNSATFLFKDTANPHTYLPVHLIASDTIFTYRY